MDEIGISRMNVIYESSKLMWMWSSNKYLSSQSSIPNQHLCSLSFTLNVYFCYKQQILLFKGIFCNLLPLEELEAEEKDKSGFVLCILEEFENTAAMMTTKTWRWFELVLDNYDREFSPLPDPMKCLDISWHANELSGEIALSHCLITLKLFKSDWIWVGLESKWCWKMHKITDYFWAVHKKENKWCSRIGWHWHWRW